MRKEIYEKGERALNYWEIDSKPLCNFGLWVVSYDGDIININYSTDYYRIDYNRVFENDWIPHLREKCWVTEQDIEDITQALAVARHINTLKQI